MGTKKEAGAKSAAKTEKKVITKTVADLKAEIDAEKMGIKYTSKSKKADLEAAIADWRKNNTTKKPAPARRRGGEY